MRADSSSFSAFEIVGSPAGSGSLIVSCEHASNRVPEPLVVVESDRPFLQTHWGWDIGAEAVARHLVEWSDSIGVFSTFSRLVCDPNRDADDATLISEVVEGYELSFNRGLDEEERKRRLKSYYEPYHSALDQTIDRRKRRGDSPILLSIHSFTPQYGGAQRTMELAVLFDDFEESAQRLAGQLEARGFVTALNEPYSGLLGMMPSAHRHGTNHGITYLEIEIRQDLVDTAAKARSVASLLLEALDAERACLE